MSDTQWIIVYMTALVLFPFIVQLCMVPILFLVDVVEKIISIIRKGGRK